MNPAAAILGVHRGARLADMRALCPDLFVEHADLAGDAAALERLMLWVRRWGPWSTVDGVDGLVLDITGAAHLFGGEAALLADIQGRMGVAGLTARLAVAPTWGAAWGLARYGSERAVLAEGASGPLMALPVAALRLGGETQLLLRRLGLRTIADLAAIPRLPLARRFARAPLAENPLLRLDQMTGRLAEPLRAPDAPPVFIAVARLAEPVQDPADWLPGLMEGLCAQLAARDRGCRRVRLTVFRVDGERREVTMGTAAPTRDAVHLLRLFDGRLEGLDPGFGFDLITLEALAVEELAAARPRLDGGRDEALAWTQLIDRLIARFGAAAVVLPEAVESHIPERAERGVPAIAAGLGRLAAMNPAPAGWREAEAGRLASGAEVRVGVAVGAGQAQPGGAVPSPDPAETTAQHDFPARRRVA